MTSINIFALQKKFSYMRWSFFLKPFVPNIQINLFQVYSDHTGCPKKLKIPVNMLKIQIYDFKHYSCSQEKVFLYQAEPLGSLQSQIHRYLFELYFHHTGCPKKWTELSHISQILANFIAFSILLDTLYGENTL